MALLSLAGIVRLDLDHRTRSSRLLQILAKDEPILLSRGPLDGLGHELGSLVPQSSAGRRTIRVDPDPTRIRRRSGSRERGIRRGLRE